MRSIPTRRDMRAAVALGARRRDHDRMQRTARRTHPLRARGRRGPATGRNAAPRFSVRRPYAGSRGPARWAGRGGDPPHFRRAGRLRWQGERRPGSGRSLGRRRRRADLPLHVATWGAHARRARAHGRGRQTVGGAIAAPIDSQPERELLRGHRRVRRVRIGEGASTSQASQSTAPTSSPFTSASQTRRSFRFSRCPPSARRAEGATDRYVGHVAALRRGSVQARADGVATGHQPAPRPTRPGISVAGLPVPRRRRVDLRHADLWRSAFASKTASSTSIHDMTQADLTRFRRRRTLEAIRGRRSRYVDLRRVDEHANAALRQRRDSPRRRRRHRPRTLQRPQARQHDAAHAGHPLGRTRLRPDVRRPAATTTPRRSSTCARPVSRSIPPRARGDGRNRWNISSTIRGLSSTRLRSFSKNWRRSASASISRS